MAASGCASKCGTWRRMAPSRSRCGSNTLNDESRNKNSPSPLKATDLNAPLAIFLLALFCGGAAHSAEARAFPVKVSENGRYFIDQKGEPVFWLGTTQWQFFRD